MDLVLADLQWSTCLVYLDDIIVFGRSFEEHLQRLDEVLGKLQGATLKVKPAKCDLFAKQVHYLGHVISDEGIRADPAKIKVVQEWPVPRNQTEVRSFVGLASYYRRFIKGFAEIARPLHQLTEKGRRFKWSPDCDRAFLTLKACLITSPVLAYPDPGKTFVLDTDASDVGIGAVLSQETEGGERVVAYASRALTKAERRYATTKKELLSMVTFMKHFRHYLLGREFVLRTDHNSLRWLNSFQGLEGQLARWMEQLASLHYKIVHRAGRLHVNADVLSRLPSFGDQVGDPQVCVLQTAAQKPEEVNNVDELREAQQGDSDIQLIISLKQGGVSQAEAVKHACLKRYLPVWDELVVRDGALVRQVGDLQGVSGEPLAQLVVPGNMVPRILYWLHNTMTGGHLGIQKVQAKVRERFFWPGWSGDVRRWCRECRECASRKETGVSARAPLVSTVTARPYERVALDILGPLPETERGKKYILVIGDYFSKWTEAFPLVNQEAVTVAKVLVEEWVCRYGCPRSLHSDQGRNFESLVFQELCQLLEINKTRTSPYSPQSDGLVERFNRTLATMLSLFVNHNQSNWDILLPFVMMAYRSSVHASTGFTPYKVLFAREMVLPVDVMLNLDHGERLKPMSEYVSSVSQTLATVVEAVKKHQSEASHRQKRCYDFRAQPQFYSVGELVWMRDKARRRGVCPKLQRRFKGPFKVKERISEVLYRVCLEKGGGDTIVHVNRLKPCVPSSFEVSSSPRGPGAVWKEWRRRGKGATGPPEVHSPASWIYLQSGTPQGGVSEERSVKAPAAGFQLEDPGATEDTAASSCVVEPGSEVWEESAVQVGFSGPTAVTVQGTLADTGGGPQPQRWQLRRERRLPAWTKDYDMQ
uniref:Gypsy retrotransposon integrase-like protein 1 n=1 Tax=Paramormyrops kingsleyae TaxID=1676925 RepID=A0A3B3QC10_9TELE